MQDLAAAQELMKIMAGAEPDKKPDYGALASMRRADRRRISDAQRAAADPAEGAAAQRDAVQRQAERALR